MVNSSMQGGIFNAVTNRFKVVGPSIVTVGKRGSYTEKNKHCQPLLSSINER